MLLMGESTISMAIFNSELLVNQRVYTNYWLVVEPIPLKNMKVKWNYCSHILWKIVFFQTTNQMGYIPIVINVCQWHIDYTNILILSFGGMIADMIVASWDMLSDCFYVYKWYM